MAYEKLTLKSLVELDGGRIREAWDQELAKCTADLGDRPGEKAARKVTLTLTLKPIADEQSHLEGCDVQCCVQAALPKRTSREYLMETDSEGGLFFNNFAPENPAQRTLDEVEKEASHAG